MIKDAVLPLLKGVAVAAAAAGSSDLALRDERPEAVVVFDEADEAVGVPVGPGDALLRASAGCWTAVHLVDFAEGGDRGGCA